MRYVTSALCAAGVIALAGCSMNSASSGSSLPNAGNQLAATHHGLTWTAINSAGWKTDTGRLPRQSRPPADPQRGGNYATEFRSSVGVFGYSPKPNKSDSPPVCSPAGNRWNVNGIASDQKGNLIVPGSSRPGGGDRNWNISVYAGSSQPIICGALLGAIPDATGQPVDAAAFNAATGSIAVSEINFTTKMGEVVICTVASLSCGAPITSTAITSYGAGVAMDAAGDCWLSTAKKIANGIPVGFRLIYWAGCTGNGVVATGTRQGSYGGLFIDNAGNLGAFDAFNSKLHVYSGCNPACGEVAEFSLQGMSFYGNLNGSGGKLAAGDVSNGSVDVYNYSMTNFRLRYSFDAGLRRSRIVESGIFAPTNQRLRR